MCSRGVGEQLRRPRSAGPSTELTEPPSRSGFPTGYGALQRSCWRRSSVADRRPVRPAGSRLMGYTWSAGDEWLHRRFGDLVHCVIETGARPRDEAPGRAPGLDRASGRLPADAPLAETPARNLPPVDERGERAALLPRCGSRVAGPPLSRGAAATVGSGCRRPRCSAAATRFGGFWAAAGWPRCATAGIGGWPGPSRSRLLHPAFSGQPDSRRRFQTEARAAAALNHPHIIAVHDTGDHAGTPYIVMERLSGRSPRRQADAWSVAAGAGPRDARRCVVGAGRSACSRNSAPGCQAGQHPVHTDRSGEARRLRHREKRRNARDHDRAIVGTMAYLSADRVAGRPATVTDDLYAVGAVGLRSAARARTFPQDNIAALARAIAETRRRRRRAAP